jgi:hypothetical protein
MNKYNDENVLTMAALSIILVKELFLSDLALMLYDFTYYIE